MNAFRNSYDRYFQSQVVDYATLPSHPLRVKNIGLCILFSLITCGFYGLYWLYCMAEDLKVLSGDSTATSGGMVVLFSIITLNIYTLYWLFKQGEFIEQVKAFCGLPRGYSDIIYLILELFGFGIVAWALLQNEINRMVEAYQG